ncbi:hypothetical protein LNP74_20945 [Klebsiella pneumoniae subsp. pneumoniae]|nr:hypothetical protein [Klebsiella pneumoniae subsp. pneumoniae]
MQFNRQADGYHGAACRSRPSTPVWVWSRRRGALQHVNSNYDIDLSRDAIASVAKKSPARPI